MNTEKYKAVYFGPLSTRYTEYLVASAPKGFSVVGLPWTASLDEMVREFKDAHFLIVVGFGAPVPDEVYRACKRLKLVQSDSGNYSHLPMPLLHELGIAAAHNVSEATFSDVAEHAVTLMLCVLRRVVPTMVAMRQGKWKWDLDYNQYTRMYQKTIGIVGLGKAAELAINNLRDMSRVLRMRDRLERGIRELIPDVKLNGHKEERLPNTLNLTLPGIRGESLVLALDQRLQLFLAQHLRLSLSMYLQDRIYRRHDKFVQN